MGQIRKRGEYYQIRYYRDGQRIEETTEFTKYEDARGRLREREGDIEKGAPITKQSIRLTFDDAARDVVVDYTANGKKTTAHVERRLRKHLTPYFGGRRLSAIRTADIRLFQVQRLAAGAKAGEINRELAILKRAFRLAVEGEKYHGHVPKMKKLEERNVRTGFFDDDKLAAVCAQLPAALQPVVMFGYVSGWRITSEVLPLEWRHVDRQTGEVRLDPERTKNRDGRVFPFTAQLWDLFADLWEQHEALKKAGIVCPYVFQRNGKRIRDFRGSWKTACTAAGCPGWIPHDLRRSAVRNMERAGLSRSVSMQLSGHLTEAVFRRYAITSEADLREGVERLDRVAGTKTPILGTTERSAARQIRKIAR